MVGLRTGIALAAVVAALGGCATPPVKVTDTGYTGTWSLGGDEVKSVVAIWKRGDEYLFRWNLRSKDGKWEVRCGWNGPCEEFVDGEKTSDYQLKVWTDSKTGRLWVERTGRVTKPDPLDVYFLDELVVEEGGRTLRSLTHKRQDQVYPGPVHPMRILTKVADGVADPPR